MDKIKTFLIKNKYEFYENFDISAISTIKLGCVLKLVIFPKNSIELERLILYFYGAKVPYRIFGNLSNVLFVKSACYPVVVTNKMIDELKFDNKLVTVSAGMLIPKFCEQMRKHKCFGVEGLIGIPASVGGAIMNNAGAYGYSIADNLVKIKVFEKGKIFDIFKNEIKFGYHYSNLNRFVILEATFLFENKNEYDIINLSNEYTYLRGKSQPAGLSLGSVFKKVNGRSAGFYIERSGLKGLREGGVVVSSKHANFFVNDKNGSVYDFLHLLAKVQVCVEKQFGLELIPEIEKVGDFNETFSRSPHTFKI